GGPKLPGGVIPFQAAWHRQRPALLLNQGVLWVTIGTLDQNGEPSNGWMFAYNPSTLQQLGLVNTSPDGVSGAPWNSGAGPAGDSAGNVYISTGDGIYDGVRNWGSSILRFSLNGGLMSIADAFTPSNWSYLNTHDYDLGSGGVILLPDPPPGTSTSYPHILVGGGKADGLFVLDRDSLGSQVVPPLDVNSVQLFETASYWNEKVYIIVDKIRVFSRGSDGTLALTQAGGSSVTGGRLTLSISANGTSNGLLWMYSGGNTFTGSLWAFDANTLATTYYSGTPGGYRDRPGVP